jgi:hypothetical protein
MYVINGIMSFEKDGDNGNLLRREHTMCLLLLEFFAGVLVTLSLHAVSGESPFPNICTDQTTKEKNQITICCSSV